MEQTHLPINHDPLLVGASFLVAIFASYATLAIINRLRQTTAPKGWLWLGAAAFGLGVWAMNFIALTALQLDLVVAYDPLLTLASVFLAVFGAAAAFQVVSRPTVSFARVLGSGFFLGAGIVVMHYVGLFAMRMDARLEFDLVMVGVSTLVAIALGTFGIWMFTSPMPFRHFITAGIAGSAITFIHYTAMMAARFTESGSTEIHAMVASGGMLSLNLFLLLAVGMIGLPLFLTSLLDAPGDKAQEVEA